MLSTRADRKGELIRALSAELARSNDYTEGGPGGFKPEMPWAREGSVIGRIRGNPVACGEIRPLEEDVAEPKRVFVEALLGLEGEARRASSLLMSLKLSR